MNFARHLPIQLDLYLCLCCSFLLLAGSEKQREREMTKRGSLDPFSYLSLTLLSVTLITSPSQLSLYFSILCFFITPTVVLPLPHSNFFPFLLSPSTFPSDSNPAYGHLTCALPGTRSIPNESFTQLNPFYSMRHTTVMQSI